MKLGAMKHKGWILGGSELIRRGRIGAVDRVPGNDGRRSLIGPPRRHGDGREPPGRNPQHLLLLAPLPTKMQTFVRQRWRFIGAKIVEDWAGEKRPPKVREIFDRAWEANSAPSVSLAGEGRRWVGLSSGSGFATVLGPDPNRIIDPPSGKRVVVLLQHIGLCFSSVCQWVPGSSRATQKILESSSSGFVLLDSGSSSN